MKFAISIDIKIGKIKWLSLSFELFMIENTATKIITINHKIVTAQWSKRKRNSKKKPIRTNCTAMRTTEINKFLVMPSFKKCTTARGINSNNPIKISDTYVKSGAPFIVSLILRFG